MEYKGFGISTKCYVACTTCSGPLLSPSGPPFSEGQASKSNETPEFQQNSGGAQPESFMFPG